MAPQFERRLGNDVQVMLSLARRTAKCFTIRDTESALVNVPEIGEAPDRLGYIDAHDHHIEIDDRLGGEARNRRAADVLYSQDQAAESSLDPRCEDLEALRP